MDLEGPEAFVSRIDRALTTPSERPITFIVGSGMSNGAVPDTSLAATMAEKLVESKQPQTNEPPDNGATDLDDPKLRYQVALRRLGSFAGPSAVKAFVQELTLAKYTPRGAEASAELATRRELQPLSPETCKLLERDRKGWNIPRGSWALGELAAHHAGRIRGPVITTNFDPLLEIAVREAGREAITESLPKDGSLHQMLLDGGDDTLRVVHVHGYWNGERHTLHARLEEPRPLLAGSLQELLTSTLVVVMGYGMWEDVFSKALREAIESDLDIDVIWCLFESPTGPLVPGTLLDLLTHAGEQVQIYSEIDVNTVLPIIAARHHVDPVKRLVSFLGSQPETESAETRVRIDEALRAGLIRLLSSDDAARVPDVVVWPHRLREPNAVHYAQAIVARALAHAGSGVLVVINDLGSNHDDALLERLESTLQVWTHAEEHPGTFVFQRLRDRHVLFPKNLTYDEVREVLELATEPHGDIMQALRSELDAEGTIQWHQALSPLVYWTYLLTLPARGLKLNRVWTLSGEHHAAAWEQFKAGVNSKVGHLLVPSPRTAGEWLVDGPALRGEARAQHELFAASESPPFDDGALATWAWAQLFALPALLDGSEVEPLVTPAGEIQCGSDLADLLAGAEREAALDAVFALIAKLVPESDAPLTPRDRC